MKGDARGLAPARRAFVDAAASLLIIASGALINLRIALATFSCGSFAEASAMLWPVILAGIVTLFVGWLMDRTEG